MSSNLKIDRARVFQKTEVFQVACKLKIDINEVFGKYPVLGFLCHRGPKKALNRVFQILQKSVHETFSVFWHEITVVINGFI